MTSACNCGIAIHSPRLVVLTGGPGGGKTSVLELVRRSFCNHVAVLPEAAGIVFVGGFPRSAHEIPRCAAQRAIFYVQRELERSALEEARAGVILCDRGTIDGIAYWPRSPDSFWNDIGATRESLLSRYAAVIHLRTPGDASGYNHSNPLRTEDASEAAMIDRKIAKAWNGHPRRRFVENDDNFILKVTRALEYIREEVPPCCLKHRVPEIGETG